MATVAELCVNLVADRSSVIVVDNTPISYLDVGGLPDGCTLIALGANMGIAHAQNVGVRHAEQCGADVIAFFDQDSRIGPGFLSALTAPLSVSDARIVAPLYVDDATGCELPSTRLNRLGLPVTVERAHATQPYAVDVVIASGTAATKEVFCIAGRMDEDFFIDFVDTEWCLRCRSRNVPIEVVPAAVMKHTIGTVSIDLRIAKVQVHNPTRCYYQLRNCFLLFRKSHVPFLFAVREMLTVFCSRALLLLFVQSRSAYIRAYLSALRDGFKGVVGVRPS